MPKSKQGMRTAIASNKPTKVTLNTVTYDKGAVGSDTQPQTVFGADTSATQQFELELCWCIQQLQGVLSSQKMNSKQAIDATRALNILQSQKAPLIRKRQAMRTAFGDYRTKMLEEEKKYNKAKHQMKLDSSSPSKKSRFFKHSASSSIVLKCKKVEPSDNSFRFNFTTHLDEAIHEHTEVANNNTSGCGLQTKQKSGLSSVVLQTNFKYQPSSNSFRFNFPIEN